MISSRERIGLLLCFTWVLTVSGYAEESGHETALQTRQDRSAASPNLPQSRTPPDIHTFSRAFGHLLGEEMRSQGIELSIQDVISGLEAGAQGKAPPIYQSDYEEMVGHYRDRGFQEKSKANLLLANAFLRSNARNEGVRELVPGKLQYKVLKPGKGAAVQENGNPQLYYSGQFIDGTPFGSTGSREAATVFLPEMIRGFQQGVSGMLEGEKRRIYVHPDLAYGVGKEVPPNSILFFDVEVVSAGPAAAQQMQQTALQVPQSKLKQEPAPVLSSKEPDNWDLSLDSYEEEDTFSTEPFQLQSINNQRIKP